MFKALNPEDTGSAPLDTEEDLDAVADTQYDPELGDELEGSTEAANAALADDTDPEEAPVDETVDDEPRLDAATVDRAKRYGIQEDDLGHFADTADLERHLTLLDRSILSRMQQPGPSQAPPPETAPPTQGDEQQQAAAFEKFKLELDPEAYSPEFVELMNKLNDHYAGQVQTLHQKLEEAHGHIGSFQQQQAERQLLEFEQTVDGLFDSLDESYADTFGRGPMAKLDANSPLAKSRNETVNEMLALRQADAQLGRPSSSWEELFRRAVAARHFDKTKTHVRQEISRQVQQRRRQGVARPVARTKPMSRDDRAAAKVVEFLRDRGFEATDSDYELDEV